MRFVITSTILLIATGNYIVNAQTISKISNDDKYQIIKSILSETDFQNSQSENKSVCISNENLSDSLTKRFPFVKGVKFIFLENTEKIEEPKCGLEFWYFSNFDLKNKSVLVSFAKARNANSYSSVTGLRYKYHREKGRWKGKVSSYLTAKS